MNVSEKFEKGGGASCWALAVGLLAVLATPCPALQLRWLGGAQNLVAADSIRTTLILDATDLTNGLPSEWRLVCVSDSTVLRFVAEDSVEVCSAADAHASNMAPPSSPFDSTANQYTARFCSATGPRAQSARYVVEVLAGAHAKLKVVALLSGTSSGVIESNVATVNGGLPEPFAPTILQATTEHESLIYSLTAIGSDLEDAASVALASPNGEWSVPLQLVSRSRNQMVATGQLAAPVPDGVASVSGAGGAVSGVDLPAEPEPALDLMSSTAGGCSAQYFEEYLVPGPPPAGYTIQPKDFAMVPGFVDPNNGRYGLHVFYIRHNYWYHKPFRPDDRSDLDEKNLGHAWTSDFNSWHGPAPGDKADTLALRVRPGKFDEFHVWAPSVVRVGPVYHMFYTGVRSENISGAAGPRNNQSIGVATSTDLNAWTQPTDAVLTIAKVPWARKNPDPIDYDGQQLRDPFVIQDPTKPGQWLMYFVTVDSLRYPRMAVGVATSSDLATWTVLRRPFEMTERPTPLGSGKTVESPHVFRRNGQWWMLYTADSDQVFMQSFASSTPADSDTTRWSGPVWLRSVTEGRPAQLQYWHATEHLGSGANDYLAAFNDNAISIEFMGVSTPTNTAIDSVRLGCPPLPPTAGVDDRDPWVRKARLSAPAVVRNGRGAEIVVELPQASRVRLVVFDALGRQQATLLDRECPDGQTVVRWTPDDGSGHRLASGLYFLRLATDHGAQTRKAVLLP